MAAALFLHELDATERLAVAGGSEIAERWTPNATILPAIAQKRSRNTRGCPTAYRAGSVTLGASIFPQPVKSGLPHMKY